MKASSPSTSITTRRLSLQAEAGDTPTAVWQPTAQTDGPPTTSSVLHASRAPTPLPAAIEATLIELVTRPVPAGETHRAFNDRRERLVGEQLARLAPIDAYQLQRRLELDRDDDALAVAFRRLAVDRRQRLRAFLAYARRGR